MDKRNVSNTRVLKTADGTLVRCLHVANVPVPMNSDMQGMENELKLLFSAYGNIKNLFCKRNDVSFKNTYAFVTFETPEQAYRMFIKRDVLRFKGRKLYVSLADSWHQPVTLPDGTINYTPSRRLTDAQKIINTLRSILEMSEQGETGAKEEEEGGNADAEEESQDTEEEIRITQDCPIAKLNDDCFFLIMEYVPFEERHVLSHVCHRWRDLMAGYWCRMTQLNFNTEPFNQVDFSEKRFELYLRLCPNITCVHITRRNAFSSSTIEIPTSQSIVKAATLCPQMLELTISGVQITGRPLAAVAHCCRNLKSLTIKTCKFDGRDNEMLAIIRKCTSLERLKLSGCNLKPGHWLGYLKGLKSLSLLCCEMNNKNFIQGLKNLKDTLEELELVLDFCSEPLNFKCLQDFSKLTSLTYVNKSGHQQKVFVDMFKNLTRLELEFNTFLNNDLLAGLVQYSPGLTSLNIASNINCSKDSKLTSDGYRVISNLKELVTLNLSMNNIDDHVLLDVADKCSNLETLSLNLCHNISDVGCKRIVQKLMKLKEVHIDSCCKVTSKTVDAAIEAATHNPEKAKLSIYAAKTGITEVQKQPHPLVELLLEDRNELDWLLSSSLNDFSDFLLDDDFTDDDDDEEDYDFDVYDEDDIYYNYPYNSDEDINFDYEDLDDLCPFFF